MLLQGEVFNIYFSIFFISPLFYAIIILYKDSSEVINGLAKAPKLRQGLHEKKAGLGRPVSRYQAGKKSPRLPAQPSETAREKSHPSECSGGYGLKRGHPSWYNALIHWTASTATSNTDRRFSTWRRVFTQGKARAATLSYHIEWTKSMRAL